MSGLPSEQGKKYPPPTCEFVSKCSYAQGCACKDLPENQCAALPGDSNLLELCREAKPNCSAKMYFGYTTIVCMCMKRQQKPRNAD